MTVRWVRKDKINYSLRLNVDGSTGRRVRDLQGDRSPGKEG